MKKRLVIIVLLWGLGTQESFSQNNIHYSQFYNSPVYLNPAMTGQIGEDLFRLNAHVRQQWFSTLGDNAIYETRFGAADISLFKNRLGLGLGLLNDVAGGGIFNTIQILPSLSYSFVMGDNALTFGFQPLINLTQFDESKIVGGVRPPGSPINSTDNSTYFDLNSGVNFKWDLYYLRANIGAAFSNLMESKQKFISTTQGTPVPRTYKAYFLVDFDVSERVKFQPGGYGSVQANSTNMLFGTNLSAQLLNGGTYGNNLILGVWFRTNDGNLEAFIPKAGLRMNKLQIMASYDAHMAVSKSGNSNYINGISNSLEISIIFTGKPKVVPPLLEDDFILNPRY